MYSSSSSSWPTSTTPYLQHHLHLLVHRIISNEFQHVYHHLAGCGWKLKRGGSLQLSLDSSHRWCSWSLSSCWSSLIHYCGHIKLVFTNSAELERVSKCQISKRIKSCTYTHLTLWVALKSCETSLYDGGWHGVVRLGHCYQLRPLLTVIIFVGGTKKHFLSYHVFQLISACLSPVNIKYRQIYWL